MVYAVHKKLKPEQKPRQTFTNRSFKGVNVKNLETDIETAPWWIFDMCKSASSAYEVFCFVIKHILDRHAPKKKLRMKKKVPKWLNADYHAVSRRYHTSHKTMTSENRDEIKKGEKSAH